MLSLLVLIAFAGVGGGAYVFYKFGRGLPDYKQLADYEPPVMTRVHAGDGRLLAEYAEQKRVFVPQASMPKRVVKAFLSAEDKNFYYHPGIDPLGIARAVVTNIKNIASDRRLVGASTITQQVAKNFLLSGD
ncbi:MAG: transglycosylase domain-containing protein, partial [Rhodospirillales bacterium]|nr:transglycosylase domain-containing protein [Rhodospirillales bacterium]